MIITLIFILVALFSVVRTVCFAVFTARDKNYAGASMLIVLSLFVIVCAVFTLLKL